MRRVVDRERIRDCLRAVGAPGTDWPGGREGHLRPAAVLVPLIERDRSLSVVLTRRATHLREHAGQISFPGGRLEPGDATPADAALREAREEIGVPPSAVELLGHLPDYRTGTGFVVSPVVGLVTAEVAFVPDPAEVAEIFEVPLDFFLDRRNHRPHILEHEGRRYRLCAMPYRDYYIWGATAGMLQRLQELVTSDSSAGWPATAEEGDRGV